ncbi:hypothetical protein HXX76_016134 [Chlamydomonas incerta]|uniref:GAF domain-containing protein n=1 Tax=Chlamydomonas incerta TaxID=51695 RepID=A0A835VQZ9_CHLIN|nr:hypothetical protein HXX76_016134 [Chlamydomonas incerta]|eukprot:KAG2422309.1 hypothetical protein HXX76_016134 [Chlamydomonas incerta]
MPEGGLDVPPLHVTSTAEERAERYQLVRDAIEAVLEDEDDWVAVMSTVACLLHEAFEYYHWTGFYQAKDDAELDREYGDGEQVEYTGTLVIGPYQGHMGCLRIPYTRGVCGAAARTRSTQLVPDVSQFPGYIACASSTRSEIVVPVVMRPLWSSDGRTPCPPDELAAVLDIDSDQPAAFTEVDQEHLEELCEWLGNEWRAWNVHAQRAQSKRKRGRG